MSKEGKQQIAIIINVLTVVFEIVAFLIRPNRYGISALAFYTVLSNIIALISSVFILIQIFTKSKNEFICELRFCACVSLIVTFIVVVFILVWFTDPLEVLFAQNNKYHHIIIPIITVISYFYCEDHVQNKHAIRLQMIYTITYSIVLIVLNHLSIVDGPYPFFMTKRIGLPLVLLSCTAMGIVVYLLCLCVYKIGLKIDRKRNG